MSPRSTLLGAVLGAAAALSVTSEYSRSTRVYWAASDAVNAAIRRLDPETSHGLALLALRARMNPVSAPSARTSARLRTRVWDLDFDNPVGMAAGFDKQARAFESVLDLGFGFVEVGGVTPEPQPGNAKPRMFRLAEDRAVINRFGLNSEGQAAVAGRLFARHPAAGRVVGVNIAKNTLSKDSIPDYCAGIRTLGPLVDFVVVNVSCPNVQSIKDLKDDEVFNLVSAVRAERDRACPHVPLLVKIGPDMDEAGLVKLARTAIECGVDGLVVSNTTSATREDLRSQHRGEAGGLSGEPLKRKALDTLRDMYRLTGGAIPIVGVGGVASGADAYERIRAGASLVEVYTALVFNGPSLLPKILHDLDALLQRDGFGSVREAVGADARK
jgi:dihydroorotate dehydrogenase